MEAAATVRATAVLRVVLAGAVMVTEAAGRATAQPVRATRAVEAREMAVAVMVTEAAGREWRGETLAVEAREMEVAVMARVAMVRETAQPVRAIMVAEARETAAVARETAAAAREGREEVVTGMAAAVRETAVAATAVAAAVEAALAVETHGSQRPKATHAYGMHGGCRSSRWTVPMRLAPKIARKTHSSRPPKRPWCRRSCARRNTARQNQY